MKSKYLFYMVLPALCLGLSCSKKLGVEAPTLNVTVTNGQLINGVSTFKLGETVQFAFSGYAANVSVYTGDAGRNYDYRERTAVSGKPQLSFTSLAQFGTQSNTLQVLAINGLPKVDAQSALAANWVDITGRATLSTGTAIASGTIDLSDLVKSTSDSLFIAFKYTGKTGSTQRTWTITNFAVNTILPEGPQVISNLANDNPYWTKFSEGTSAANWTTTTAQLQVVGGTATAPDNVSWIISKPLFVSRVAPDWAVGLKNIGNANLTTYNYKYLTVGKYKATFIIFNNSIDETSKVIKEIPIEIVP